ncbi:MAG: bile acid:sodium symporter [Gammaproteobacteria bacterium]|uniref:arsenic resistance protein n=1 Tax=Rhodoferax sp. TaxID=50421 RepID=UPI001846D40B|nr:bile acid:sodium symporter [Rhodoferax sp.]MBU3900222.1 bile acid:sodium symporter [Gammaproteobacteria bacterium]MBA3058800.1 arsenic resistance protein [Rhodoferax sp.]MBU3999546.1 bile acid:sodium symporter [Gammaproteobacteria bacterium]MBU4082286.1 bile acid:sodium symporter [Gammaproteobacteria bacterium]MBU4114159.1 bile acid:sodium symporter [Gammaproteobacteria bacterium]
MKQHAAHLGEHLRQRLFFYASGAIALGWVMGANFPEAASAHTRALGWIMNALVFLMIYPMMIGLNLAQLPKALKQPRPLLLTLFYNFVITPALSYALVQAMAAPPELALGFYLVMLIPGASMAIAFTGMAGGSIEVATLAQAVGFLVVPFALPFFMHWAGQSQAMSVPLASLVTTVVLVLILPMALGDVTRRALVRRFGPAVLMRIKPFLGVIPALTMLVVMALIFFSKGAMLAQNWQMLLPLMVATLAFLLIILALMTWLNRRMGLSYAEHMAVAFVSSGKNNATAIAIAISTAGFGPMVAVPAATLPMFQAVLLVGYVHLADRLRRYYAQAA